MSIETRKMDLINDLDEIRKRLGSARYDMQQSVAAVSELEREEMALQSALDILGEKTIFRQKAEGMVKPTGKAPTGPWSADLGRGTETRTEVVDGIEYVIEPGYELSKNSFGEISILPVGTKATPMAEPTKPDNKALILPPVSVDESFSAPEDQL